MQNGHGWILLEAGVAVTIWSVDLTGVKLTICPPEMICDKEPWEAEGGIMKVLWIDCVVGKVGWIEACVAIEEFKFTATTLLWFGAVNMLFNHLCESN